MNESSQIAADPETPQPSKSLNRAKPAGIVIRLATALAVLFAFAGDGLFLYFSGDDLMNLYKYVEKGWSVAAGILRFWSSDYYRPVGGIAYLGTYAAFGFNNGVFKALLFLLLVLNLVLAWRVGKQILGDSRAALFAVLLIAYHAAENELYYNFGTIYDVLCFTFLLSAVAFWLHSRRGGRYPGAFGLLLLAVLQILALGCKEMGVCLPAFLFLWEFVNGRLLYRRKPWVEWRVLPALTILGALVLVYIAGKAGGAASLTNQSFYKPVFTAHVYFTNMNRYLNEVFYVETIFSSRMTALFLAGGLAVAAALRLRVMAFGWLWFIVGMLPVAFIAPRAAFVLYIPLWGLAVGATALLTRMSQTVWKGSARLWFLDPAKTPVFVLALVFLCVAHYRNKPIYDRGPKQLPPVRQVWAEDLRKAGPSIPGASILFLSDPYPEESWDTLFLTSLVRKDPRLSVARAKTNVMLLSPAVSALFNEVFDYRDGHLIRIAKESLAAEAEGTRKIEGYADPRFGLYTATDAWWWTEKEFEIAARCPESKQACHLDVTLVTPLGPFDNGERRTLYIDVGGSPLPAVPIVAQFDPTPIGVPLTGGQEQAVRFRLDRALAQDRLNGDNRPLAIVVSDIRLR